MGTRIATLALLISLFAAGCAGGGKAGEGPPTVTLYVSAPLSGAEAPLGRAIVRGSRRALAEAGGEVGDVRVEAVYLDEMSGSGRAARWSPVAVARNARRASRDASAIAYVEGTERASLRTSAAILDEAMILHLAPDREYASPRRWAAYGSDATKAVLTAIEDAVDPTSRAAVGDAYRPTPGSSAHRAEPPPGP